MEHKGRKRQVNKEALGVGGTAGKGQITCLKHGFRFKTLCAISTKLSLF